MIAHDRFTIDRMFTASRQRLFTAFADQPSKAVWFGPEGQPERLTLDFRIGGCESLHGRNTSGGFSFTYDATFRDIVPDERIVYDYHMTVDGRRISVSVATLEFLDAGPGQSRLILTELGAFFDGLDDNGSREAGTKEWMESLAAWL